MKLNEILHFRTQDFKIVLCYKKNGKSVFADIKHFGPVHTYLGIHKNFQNMSKQIDRTSK